VRRWTFCRFREASWESLEEAVEGMGYPAVVKSEGLGYDGKGQYRISSRAEIDRVRRNHGREENFVVEEFVEFSAEVSAVGLRNTSGDIRIYPVTENVHEGGILIYNHTSLQRISLWWVSSPWSSF